MRDITEHLEKLSLQIAECEMIRDLATDTKKRELFTRLAEHFRVLAGEIEKTMAAPMPGNIPGPNAQEPFPKEE